MVPRNISGEAMTELELVQGTLDVLVLRTLSWGTRHGYAVARWIKESSGDARRVTAIRAVTISLSGNSRLVYFETTGLYRFVWKTSKSWAMQCRELIVTLDDGTVHRALFTFTR